LLPLVFDVMPGMLSHFLHDVIGGIILGARGGRKDK
jgi:hypothetical protein